MAGQNPIDDPKVNAVLDRLHARARSQLPGLLVHLAGQYLKGSFAGDGMGTPNPAYYRDKLIPLGPEQGRLAYLLCRSLDAKRVVEFGTSFGVSTLYLASAIRANGGGVAIGTERDPSKAQNARRNFAEAGLSDFIELREGDAFETLKDCGGPVDFLLVDGWPKSAAAIVRLMAPQLRKGAVIICDNVGQFPRDYVDYLSFVRDEANGFSSTLLPLRGGTEMSVKTRA
ncbi:MAG: class I SAM-dependent methyltransferase [Rhizomicrobium sp.]